MVTQVISHGSRLGTVSAVDCQVEPQLTIRLIVCSLLVATPWFWPILFGPLPAMWPDLFAWCVGALLLALLPNSPRAGLCLVWGWSIAALGSCALGLLQYFDLEDGLFPWIVTTVPGYVTANVHQINMLATLLAVGLLCVWWLRVRQLVSVAVATGMSLLLLIGVAATASRTGMLHLVAISVLLLYWHARQWRRVLLVLTVGWLVYGLVTQALPWLAWATRGIVFDRNLFDRFNGQVGCQSRLVLWRNMLELIAQKPWTGWGAGELLYAQYITNYDTLRFCDKLSNAHNLPLQIAVTMGLPVAVAVSLLFLYALFKLKPWAVANITERFAWGVLLLIGLHSLLEYPLWFGVFQLMAALAAWLIFLCRRDRLAFDDSTSVLSLQRRAAVSLVLIAGLAFVSWDYIKVSQVYLPEAKRLQRYKDNPFEAAQGSVLFPEYVLVAQVVVTTPSRENAALVLHAAAESLHVTPDSRIIRRVIEAASLLGRDDLVQLHTARYKAAWPKEYAEWVVLQKAEQTR